MKALTKRVRDFAGVLATRRLSLVLCLLIIPGFGGWRLYENRQTAWEALVPPRLAIATSEETVEIEPSSFCWTNTGSIGQCITTRNAISPLILAKAGSDLRLIFESKARLQVLEVILKPSEGQSSKLAATKPFTFALPASEGRFEGIVSGKWSGGRRLASYPFSLHLIGSSSPPQAFVTEKGNRSIGNRTSGRS